MQVMLKEETGSRNNNCFFKPPEASSYSREAAAATATTATQTRKTPPRHSTTRRPPAKLITLNETNTTTTTSIAVAADNFQPQSGQQRQQQQNNISVNKLSVSSLVKNACNKKHRGTAAKKCNTVRDAANSEAGGAHAESSSSGGSSQSQHDDRHHERYFSESCINYDMASCSSILLDKQVSSKLSLSSIYSPTTAAAAATVKTTSSITKSQKLKTGSSKSNVKSTTVSEMMPLRDVNSLVSESVLVDFQPASSFSLVLDQLKELNEDCSVSGAPTAASGSCAQHQQTADEAAKRKRKSKQSTRCKKQTPKPKQRSSSTSNCCSSSNNINNNNGSSCHFGDTDETPLQSELCMASQLAIGDSGVGASSSSLYFGGVTPMQLLPPTERRRMAAPAPVAVAVALSSSSLSLATAPLPPPAASKLSRSLNKLNALPKIGAASSHQHVASATNTPDAAATINVGAITTNVSLNARLAPTPLPPSLSSVRGANESVRWQNECADADEERQRIELYKLNRRKRYIEQRNTTTSNTGSSIAKASGAGGSVGQSRVNEPPLSLSLSSSSRHLMRTETTSNSSSNGASLHDRTRRESVKACVDNDTGKSVPDDTKNIDNDPVRFVNSVACFNERTAIVAVSSNL